MIVSHLTQRVLLRPAVVVEWETVLAESAERAAACLTALCNQLWILQDRFDGIPEVVITYSPRDDVAATIESLVRRSGGQRGWPGTVLAAPVPDGTDYYRKKNFGFSLTTADAIVFLDSDLIPDDGWLEGLLAPLQDYRKSVVVGNTYMDTTSWYARCVALFWIFDTRAESPVLARTRRLVSNSIAFRRTVFARCPFPQRSTFRGQCSELATILQEQGITLYMNYAAQSVHPPPNGIARFVERAIWAGHDKCSYQRLDGPAHIGDALSAFRTDLRVVRTRIAHRRLAIGAGTGTAIGAACLGVAYYTLKLCGYLMTLAFPSAVRRLAN